MIIRKAIPADIPILRDLYYNTITTINTRDYTPEQIQAWASTADNLDSLKRRLDEQYFYVAMLEDIIVGFASLGDSGYFDLLYVHKDHQRQGVATALYKHIFEKVLSLGLKEITVEASLTAKPFFESRGFETLEEQIVHIKGVGMVNYKMRLSLNLV